MFPARTGDVPMPFRVDSTIYLLIIVYHSLELCLKFLNADFLLSPLLTGFLLLS